MTLQETFEVPKFQKAIVVKKSGPNPELEVVEDYPVPEPGEAEILVKLIASGICHSDVSILQESWGFVPDCKVSGHEGSGYVVKHGPNSDSDLYPVGTAVGVALNSNPCKKCNACQLPGGEVFCKNSPYYGCALDGTWQQYVIIKKNYVILLPSKLTPIEMKSVGPVLCGGVTSYKALKKMGKPKGSTVVITGAGGGLGSFGLQYAKEMGYKTLAIDTGTDKREMSLKLGAEKFIDFRLENCTRKVMEYTEEKGADAVVIFASNEKGYNEALEYLGFGGNLICVGIPNESAKLSFRPAELIYTGKSVTSSLVGTRDDMQEALEYFSAGKVTTQSHIVTMYEVQKAVNSMIRNEVKGRLVIDLE